MDFFLSFPWKIGFFDLLSEDLNAQGCSLLEPSLFYYPADPIHKAMIFTMIRLIFPEASLETKKEPPHPGQFFFKRFSKQPTSQPTSPVNSLAGFGIYRSPTKPPHDSRKMNGVSKTSEAGSSLIPRMLSRTRRMQARAISSTGSLIVDKEGTV